jgi:hypothetical protein
VLVCDAKSLCMVSPRPHTCEQRCAIYMTGCNWQPARLGLWRLTHRALGAGTTRRAPPASTTNTELRVGDVLSQLPEALRGGVQLLCDVLGETVTTPVAGQYQPDAATLARASANALSRGASTHKSVAHFLFNLASRSPVCSYLPAGPAHILSRERG